MATKAALRAAHKAKYDERKREERERGLLAQEKDRAAREEKQHQIEKRKKAKAAAALIAMAPKPETTEEI